MLHSTRGQNLEFLSLEKLNAVQYGIPAHKRASQAHDSGRDIKPTWWLK